MATQALHTASNIEGGIVLPINLSDLRQAVIDYLDNKVTVEVSKPKAASGQVIGPNETFTFGVTVTNAGPGNGGIALTNVRYNVGVEDPQVAKIRVPSNGTATDEHGQPIPFPFTLEVGFFSFNPSDINLSYLQVGEAQSITFSGKAGPGPGSGSTPIIANILADPDINALFPRNFPSAKRTTNVEVSG